MSRAIFKYDEATGVTSITCIRGLQSKMNLVVKDRQGNEYYSILTKKQFESKSDDYGIDVYDMKSCKQDKKFLKGFLEIVKEC